MKTYRFSATGIKELVPVRNLKKGDKVNGHEYGWLIVHDVKSEYDRTTVTFVSAFGIKESVFYEHFENIEKVADGIYTF